MAGFDTPPVIQAESQPNPRLLLWHLKFSIIWASALGLIFLLSVPRIIRAMRTGRGPYDFRNWVGIKEHHQPVKPERSWAHRIVSRNLRNVAGILKAFFRLTIPKVGVNVGQVILLVAYIATVLLCCIKDTKLLKDPNRPGILSLAQLPIVFLFSTKKSIVSFLLGPGVGYEKLNFLHRWSGRVMFLAALLHSALWIKIMRNTGKPILGPKKPTAGILAFAFLALIVLISLRPGRKFAYQVFFILHLAFAVGFYVTIIYHTLSAIPWIYPPIAIYGLDILLRMSRYRFRAVFLVPVGKEVTLVHLPYATSGWVAGQHIRLRILFSARMFESHPFTIFSAPPGVTCITSMSFGLSLGVRVAGDWTRALNKYANEMEKSPIQKDAAVDPTVGKTSPEGSKGPLGVSVKVLIDGPYGGSSLDLGDYETILLISGGSGITFTLGLLDDIVGRCIKKGRKNGEKTKQIEFSWCIKSFEQLEWFSSALVDIATIAASSATSASPIHLHISIYVTGLGDLGAVPSIPNCDVIVLRPSVYEILHHLVDAPKDNPSATGGSNSSKEPKTDRSSTEIIAVDKEEGVPSVSEKLPCIEPGGGLAVCASGPASLTSKTANAVSRVQLSKKGRELGVIGLHTEVFAL